MEYCTFVGQNDSVGDQALALYVPNPRLVPIWSPEPARSLRADSRVSPDHCQVWPPNKWKIIYCTHNSTAKMEKKNNTATGTNKN